MRDYKHEYRNYHARSEQKQNRAARNLWNRRLKGNVPAGKEIDHRRPLSNGGSNERSNIRYRSISSNRADKSSVKTAMWVAFEDEMMKIANSPDLTEMEKEAILKHLKRGYKSLAKKADDLQWRAAGQYVKGLNKVGLDPLEAQGLANSAMNAGVHGGVLAAGKNIALGAAVNKAKKSKRLRRVAAGMGAVFGEDLGVGGMLSNAKNVGADMVSYGARPSYEGAIDMVGGLFS
jgi:hypothetical protein